MSKKNVVKKNVSKKPLVKSVKQPASKLAAKPKIEIC
jgi:hypothetical protein